MLTLLGVRIAYPCRDCDGSGTIWRINTKNYIVSTVDCACRFTLKPTLTMPLMHFPW